MERYSCQFRLISRAYLAYLPRGTYDSYIWMDSFKKKNCNDLLIVVIDLFPQQRNATKFFQCSSRIEIEKRINQQPLQLRIVCLNRTLRWKNEKQLHIHMSCFALLESGSGNALSFQLVPIQPVCREMGPSKDGHSIFLEGTDNQHRKEQRKRSSMRHDIKLVAYHLQSPGERTIFFSTSKVGGSHTALALSQARRKTSE